MIRPNGWQRLATLGAALVLGAAVTGCGNDECGDAVDKLDDCGLLDDLEEQYGKADDECNGSKDECVANCINDSSCDEIEEGLSGHANSFTSCVIDC